MEMAILVRVRVLVVVVSVMDAVPRILLSQTPMIKQQLLVDWSLVVDLWRMSVPLSKVSINFDRV